MSTARNAPSLADRVEITDLTITYCWALDTRQWDALDDVFTPDATAFLVRDLVGRQAIKDLIRPALDFLDDSQHMVTNHQITVTGDTATCRCYMHAQHIRHAVEGSPLYVIAGRYEDRLVRTDRGWRIAHRDLLVMWREGNVAVVQP